MSHYACTGVPRRSSNTLLPELSIEEVVREFGMLVEKLRLQLWELTNTTGIMALLLLTLSVRRECLHVLNDILLSLAGRKHRLECPCDGQVHHLTLGELRVGALTDRN